MNAIGIVQRNKIEICMYRCECGEIFFYLPDIFFQFGNIFRPLSNLYPISRIGSPYSYT